MNHDKHSNGKLENPINPAKKRMQFATIVSMDRFDNANFCCYAYVNKLN